MRDSRYSGFITALPARVLSILPLKTLKRARPKVMPMPSPRYERPVMPVVKPYCSWKTDGKVVKGRCVRPTSRAEKMQRARTIDENTGISTGRTIERAKRAVGVSPESPLATSRRLLRSTESLAALLFKSTGAYVSRTKISAAIETVPL